VQLLEGEKLLLVVADRAGNLSVYLDRLEGMDGTIVRCRGKPLNREKIGQEFLLAYDESKKMLAVVSSDKVLVRLRSASLLLISPAFTAPTAHFRVRRCARISGAGKRNKFGSLVQRCIVYSLCMLCERKRRIGPCQFTGTGEGVFFSDAPVSVRLILVSLFYVSLADRDGND
jgi:hypothetical protein